MEAQAASGQLAAWGYMLQSFYQITPYNNNHDNSLFILEKYLFKGKADRNDDTITVPADGEEWSVRRLSTIDVRRS